MNRKHKIFLALLMPFLASILVCCFGSDSVFAHTATLTTSSSVSLDALPSHDGVAIDEESINVTTTCQAGYNLSIATSTSSDLYLNGDGTTTATFTAVDGTSTLANSDNKWGYSLTANASSSTVFSPLSTTASVLKTPSQTASQTDIDDTFSIYYGTKAGSSVTPGSYQMANSGAIVYYLTMEPTCSTVDIAYDGNNADAGTMGAVNTGIIHTGVKDGDEINLIASNFSKSGYGFAGWSTDANAGTKLIDNDNTNNPVVYGPQETVTLPNGFADNDTDNDGIVKLYAVWIQSQGNLQGWMGCSNLDTATYDSNTGALDLTKNSITALTDQRDNDTYAVARLADGKCWMIENLRLENTGTDNTNGSLAQGYGGQFAGLADPEPAWSNNITTANSLYSTDGADSTINIGTSNAGYRFPRYNNINTPTNAADRPQNPTSNTFANNSTTVGMYSYGNYYSWHAAIADTTAYTSNNTSVTNTSICPTGWHLPKGGNNQNTANNEFLAFSEALIGAKPANYDSQTYPYYTGTPEGTDASNKLRAYPNNFVYSGYVGSGSVYNRGSYGYYWSSTANSSDDAYYLYLDSSYVTPGTSDSSKYLGWTVRCVASDPETYTLSYDANGGSGAPSSPAPVYSNGFATFTISSTTPTRSGYTFIGWSDEKGNEVQPGGTFRTKDTNAVLYAIWTNNNCNPTATTIGTGNTSTDAVCLQDVKPGMKASLPIADETSGTYNLIDARDGQSYTVAKLADGELWLTKNLNYGNNSDILLTSHDTDLPTGSTFKSPASTTSFGTADNTTTRVSPKILTDSTYGGYYSYAAAVASTTAYSVSGQNITTSICPKGWDLPTSTIYNNLRTVSGNTTFAKMSAAPYSFKYAGYRNGASFASQTTALRLWTSTNYSASYAYYTTAYGTAAYSSNYKRYGESVRCIASNGTVTINYDGNGTTEHPVTGTVVSQTNVDINSTNAQPGTGFTRTNWAFSGWNTAADGTGTAIAANTSIATFNPAPDSTITLYAQWTPQRQIIYNDNCSYNNAGCATSTDTTNTSSWTNAGSNITLGGDTYFTTRPGYAITSWNTARDGSGTSYNISSSYTVPSTITAPDQVTLYAQWSPALTINFNGNGGTGTMTAQLIPENTSKALRSNSFSAPSGSGNYFIGWMTEESRTTNTVVYINKATYTTPATVTPGDSITLYAKWGPKYTIVYNGNNATGGSMISSGTELKHTDINEGSTVHLYAPNYWKTNYGFVGWSPSPTATVGGTDPIYGPNESISAPSYDTYGEEISGTKTITLYAIWQEADSTKTMQTFTAADCQNLSQTTFNTSTGKITTPAGSVIALKDQRDNNVYTVARLADGKCWMTENLRLESANSTSSSLSQGFGGAFTGLDSSENANFTDTTTATPNNLYNSTNITGSYSGYRFPRYNNNNTNTSLTASYNGTGSSTYYSWYSYGNYYTWTAAMANTTFYSSATGFATPGSESAGTSICPTNWTLPTSDTAKDFGILSQRYGGTGSNQSSTDPGGAIMSNRFRSFPNNFLYSGTFGDSSAYSRGSYGSYWSRSARGYGDDAYSLRLNSKYLFPSYEYSDKCSGFSVRCLVGS